MQKKNISIAILCVTILLFVPFTSISGASIRKFNTKEQVIEEAKPIIQYYFFDELVELINELLVDYRHMPEIADACNEALEVIDSIKLLKYPRLICYLLEDLGYLVFYIAIYFFMIGTLISTGVPSWAEPFYKICTKFYNIYLQILIFGAEFDCWEEPVPYNFEIETGLNLQTTQFSISNYKLNGCPCMQE
jgi:hypothetical protein